MLSPEQERAHYTGIGSSTAAAIVGLDPHCTPFRAWQLLTDPASRPDLRENLPVKLGNAFEGPICDLAAQRWGLQLRALHPSQTLRRPDAPHFLAHPDRLVVNENAAVEAKFRGLGMRAAYADNDDNPLDAEYVQCQWQCFVGGFEAVYLVVVLGNAEERHWRVNANAEDIRILEDECGEFWRRFVVTGEAPAPQTLADVKARYPTSFKGKSVETNSTIATAIDHLRAVRSQRDALKGEDEELSNLIAAAFGEAEALTYAGRIVATFKSQGRSDIDVTRLRAEYPEIAALVERNTTHRVLRLKGTYA